MENFIITEWFGITIFRPNNLITNFIVGAIGALLAWRLWKNSTYKNPFLYYWMGFFLFVGLGGAAGGVAHGLNYDFPEIRHTYLHKFAWVLGGLGLFLGEMGSLQLLSNSKLRNGLQMLMVSKLLFYVFYLYYSQIYQVGDFNHFDIVRFNSAFAVLGIMLPCQLYYYFREHHKAAFYVIGGILSLPLTILFYNFKINFASWFDYNDISHVIEIFCLVLMFTGIRKAYDDIVRGLTDRSLQGT